MVYKGLSGRLKHSGRRPFLTKQQKGISLIFSKYNLMKKEKLNLLETIKENYKNISDEEKLTIFLNIFALGLAISNFSNLIKDEKMVKFEKKFDKFYKKR